MYRGVSPYGGYFIEKMMAKERDERYQNPREMVEDIQQVVQGAQSLEYQPEEDAVPQRRRSQPSPGRTPAQRAPSPRTPARGTRRPPMPRRTGRLPKRDDPGTDGGPRRLSRRGRRRPPPR